MTAGWAAEREIAEGLVSRFSIDLDRLTVLTEAASGAYLCTPLLAALAGAERVLAVTADSRYAPASEVIAATAEAAREWGVDGRVETAVGKNPEWLASADIVTNSGFVRPIDAGMIEAMKPTAVIPLMWETWELREQDLDLDAARERRILVLGTNETRPPCDMRGYSGPLALKLLGELGLDGSARVALLGGQDGFGAEMAARLPESGVRVEWFSDERDAARPYSELPAELPARAGEYDALLIAEHRDPRPLLGPGGAIDPADLAAANPELRVGILAGNVDAAALRASGLRFAPDEILPFGYTTYQPSELGPRPVLELYAAGLSVGEAMARARLRGAPPAEAAREALERSPAMDFEGELAWA